MISKYWSVEKVQVLLLIGLCFFAFGLSFSKIILSLSTIYLSLITLLEWDKKKYWNAFKSNAAFSILLLFISFHFLNYFWTDNTEFFWKDINIKMSFYALPFVFLFNQTLEKKHIHIVLYCFLSGLFLSSLINFIHYFVYTSQTDFREMSIFLSHIRFGLMMSIGVSVSIYLMFFNEKKHRIFFIFLILWFLIYIYFSEVISAYISILISAVFYFCYYLHTKWNKKIVLLFLGFLLVLITSITFYYIQKIKVLESKIIYPKTNELTIKGNQYESFPTNKTMVNGTPVYTYICKKELEEEWCKVSDQNLHAQNSNGYVTYYILLQYMSSKGYLKKDAQHFKKLSKKDIKNIEKGIYNCCVDKSYGMINRLQDIKREWNDNDPNGKTIRQRIEYFKVALHLFTNNWLIGVSSGDLEDEFNNYYKTVDSKLWSANRLRTHNQFLTYFASFGIIGGGLFLLFCVLFFNYIIKKKNIYYFIILTLLILSFMSEDTLETQMGASITGFFIGILSFKERIMHYEN
ncbi:MAG: O-antigen ligase family protein [Flavobacteriia bacterium]|nr:O-antigen ligase family protein [Flavobacteriia bacterium]